VRSDTIDHRTDLYSAGVILYGLCAGKKPFDAPDELEVLRMHLRTPPVPPRKAAPDRGISAALEKVILRALEKERDNRFYHAEEMLQALRATPEGGGLVSRRRWRRAALMFTLVGAGATAGVVARSYLQPAPPFTPPAPVAALPEAPSPSASPAVREVVAQPDAAIVGEVAAADAGPAAPDLSTLTTEQKIEALLTAEQLADAERYLRAEAILQPRAGWVHLLLGDIYFRRLWRGDAIREWSIAVELEPALRRDPRLLHRLCATLASGWKGAGEHFLVSSVGKFAADAMVECIQSTDDPDRLRAAVRALERIGQRGRIDRNLVETRLNLIGRRPQQ
jgi:hypothetical protein